MASSPPSSYLILFSRCRALRLWRWSAAISAALVCTTLLRNAFSDRLAVGEVTGLVYRSLSLATERSLAVYWSSLLLALTATLAVACWTAARARGIRSFQRHGWLLLGAGLLALSLDESASLHERVASTGLPDVTFGFAVGWIAILAPVFLIGVAVMGALALGLVRRDPAVAAFLAAGAVLYLAVLLFEQLEVRSWGPDFTRSARAAGSAAIEEGAELAGTLAVLAAALRFLVGPDAWRARHGAAARISVSPATLRRFAVGALVLASVVAVWSVLATPGALDHSVTFVGPLPWFSALALLLTATGAMLRHCRALAALAFVWALDQGAGLLLTEQLWAGSPRASMAAHVAIAAATLVAGFAAARRIADPLGARRTMLWAASMAAAALLPTPVLIAAGVVAAQWLLAPMLLERPVAVALTGRRRQLRSGWMMGAGPEPAAAR